MIVRESVSIKERKKYGLKGARRAPQFLLKNHIDLHIEDLQLEDKEK